MSTLKVNTIQNTSAAHSSTPEEIAQGRAKAWVNFNGEGTIAIRDSFNVSSITDVATGRYTIVFSNAMSNANYAFSGTAGNEGNTTGTHTIVPDAALSTSQLSIRVIQTSSSTTDQDYVSVIVFGDQ
tara:strand:- start:40 stop:420 length:381 start_codon:yes stop_codon:yes gene_type:complete